MTARISIIIPVYNAGAELADCLAALNRQVDVPAPFEVLIIDDGSSDDAADMVNGFSGNLLRANPTGGLRGNLKLLQQPHAGPAAARNRGLQAAQGELVFFTDADCIPADDWLAAMTRSFDRPEVTGCKGTYATRQTEFIARFCQLEYQMKYQAMVACDTIDFVDTYSAGYRRSALLAAGGFDPSFPGASAEDVELAFRLSAQGHRLVFNPAAVVWHRHPASLIDYLRRKARYAYWRARVYAQHPSKLRGDSSTPRALWWQLPLACAWPPLAALSVRWPATFWMFMGVLALFLVACRSFISQAAKQSLALALVTPVLLWLRALVLVGGLLAGVTQLCCSWIVSWATAPRAVKKHHL